MNIGPDEKEPSLPLSTLDVWLCGSSHVGALTAHLLTTQGASVRRVEYSELEGTFETVINSQGTALPNVVIDAVLRKNSDAATNSSPCEGIASQLRDAAEGGVFVTFSAFPDDFPFEPGYFDENLINGVMGLELLSDEQALEGQLPVSSAYAAANAAIETMLCLISKAPFTRIEVSLATTYFTLLGRNLVNPADKSVGDEMSGPRFPIANIYECRDGRFVQCHGTTTRFSDGLCVALEHPEWIEQARVGMKSLRNEEEVEAWREQIQHSLRSMSAQVAQRKIVEHGGSATVCLTRDEWKYSAQARSAEIFALQPDELENADHASTRVGPAVVVREDTSSRVQESHLSSGNSLTRSRPLEGIRVVDLSIVLAGPTCSRVLAEWGADVIKVDSPTRPVSPFSWLDVNRSKRSILVDLKKDDGKAVLNELIKTADVILENFRAGKLDALGFDYDTVSHLHPGIIYASMNAFDYAGPMEHDPGWEHNAEAVSGMQVARSINGTPKAVPYPVNDYLTGLLGAFGILMAIYHRDRTRNGAQVSGSLARSATFTQLSRFAMQDQRELSSLGITKLIHCRDGVLVVGDTPHNPVFDIEAFRGEAENLDMSQALLELEARGVRAVISRDVASLFVNGYFPAHTLSWSQSSVGSLRQAFTRHYGDFRDQGMPRHPAPDPGADTLTILRSLHYDDTRVRKLIDEQTVAASRPLVTKVEA